MKKNILITGSSRGIGASIARLAKERGYEVTLHGKKKSQSLTKLALELDSNYLVFDVCKEREVIKALSSINRIDILVNSAGINISKPFVDLSDHDWRAIFKRN